jgi:hypothetical protein
MRLNKLASSIALTLGVSLTTAVPALGAPAAPFDEYFNQWGLGAISVLDPWGVGALGQGVVVGVVDSGIRASHVDLAGQIAPGGTDLVNGDSDPNDDTDDGHGTFVSGIIAAARNNLGMVGVAYGSKLLAVKVTDEDQNQDFRRTAAGIDYAVTHGARVINLSLVNRSDAHVEAALLRAASAGVVVAMAAGNAGGGGPSYFAAFAPNMSGAGIAVGAVNADGTIAPFSNVAGGLAQWYMVAPGVNIFSTSNSNDAAFRTDPGGTSWATAHVSGAAAVLMSLFPNLTAAQVVDILFTAATDLGAPGVDPVYGHGLLNLGRAIAPIGEVETPTDDSDSGGGGSGAGVAIGALVVGGGLAYALTQKSEALKKTLIIDEYDRGYTIDLTRVLEPRDDTPGLSSLLGWLGTETQTVDAWMPGGHHINLLAARPADALTLNGIQVLDDPSRPDADPVWSATIDGDLAQGARYSMRLNTDPRSQFGRLAGEWDGQRVAFVTQTPFTAPYAGFSGDADSVMVGYDLGDRAALTFGLVSVDDDAEFGLKSDAAVIEASYDVAERLTLGLQFGQLSEYGGLFGGASDGPVSVDAADTTALGFNGRWHLGHGVSLVGQYSKGLTRVNDARNSVIHDFSGLRSSTFGLGMVADSVWATRDRLGVAMSRPLRVSSGEATLQVAHARDLEGQIYWNTEVLDLVPDGSETDFEAFYQRRLRGNAEVGAYLLYQEQPLHDPQADGKLTVYTTLKLGF